MKLLKLKPNKRSIIGLAGGLGLLILACVALFVKQQQSLAVVNAELEAKKKQVEEGAALASRLDSTLKLLQGDRDQLKFLEAALPNVAYVPTLLKQVEDLARATHNEVRGVRPRIEVKPPPRRDRRSDPEAEAKGAEAEKQKSDAEAGTKEPDPYDKLKIQLTFTGGYQDCLQFIQRLTAFPKIVAVDDVALHPRVEEDASHPRIDVELNLTAYILQDKASQKTPVLPDQGETKGQAA
jgi:Tfp pilus assembly protein PilO